MLETDGIGTAETNVMTVNSDEDRLLASAVRESVRRQVLSLVRRRGLDPAQAIPCPRCGDNSIYLTSSQSFVFDRNQREYLCKACAAERDLNAMVRPTMDLGGEGG